MLAAVADDVQVLNLFLALLLSSFGAQSLSKNNGDEDGGVDEAPNKLMEAIDRIKRWSAFIRSRCCPLSPSHRTVINGDQPPLLDDSHSLPDLGQSLGYYIRLSRTVYLPCLVCFLSADILSFFTANIKTCKVSSD